MREILMPQILIRAALSYRKIHKTFPKSSLASVIFRQKSLVWFLYIFNIWPKNADLNVRQMFRSNIEYFYGKRAELSPAYLPMFPVSGHTTSAQQETKIYRIVIWGQQNLKLKVKA